MLVQSVWDSLLNHWPLGEREFFTFSVWFVPTFMFWIGNGILALFPLFKWFEGYKIQPSKAPDSKLVKRTLIDIALNHFVARPIIAYYLYPVFKHFGMPSIHSPLPSLFTVVSSIIAFMLFVDTTFYWSHRLLHHRLIYKYIHKQHHEYKTSIGIAAEYANPIETIISNTFPTIGCCMFMGSHLGLALFWFALREWETLEAHSGYYFPYSFWHLLPFQSGSERHDYHHSANVGNFGAFFTFWDWICGTDKSYNAYKLRNKTNQEQLKSK
eukprot:TRINITY_DN10369_c0_g1_i2.p1 TRINITY_DN10369_c0_g1~~TRINITY_DN10369_c0_g1_i2.p1  ORF type:complete len:269 (-),score=62.09 TRINITY_DN10369_c0_g1_i2:88-894(-)